MTMSISIQGRNYQAIIFDVDDTLIDTSRSYDVAIVSTVKHFTQVDIEPRDLNLVRTKGIAYGVNNDWHVTWLLIELSKHFSREHWETVLVDRKLPEIDQATPDFVNMQAFFQGIYLGYPPFNGKGLIDTAEKRLYSADFFPILQRLGVQIAVVTSRPSAEARYTLDTVNGLLGKFIPSEAFIISAGSRDSNGGLIPEKPSPQPIWECVKRLHVTPQQCIYVGNSLSDYLAAKRALVDFVQVGTSYIERDHEPVTFSYYHVVKVNELLD